MDNRQPGTRTDSLSETEERRSLLLRWLLFSEDWLVTVKRRVDMKLLLAKRSLVGTHRITPRHGMYLAMADLGERYRLSQSSWHQPRTFWYHSDMAGQWGQTVYTTLTRLEISLELQNVLWDKVVTSGMEEPVWISGQNSSSGSERVTL